MTIMSAAIVALAFALGGFIGWVLASGRKGTETRRAAAERERALAERDLARSEREKGERLVASMHAAVADAQRGRAIAETRLADAERLLTEDRAFIENSRRQIEDTFVALANRTLTSVGEQLIQLGKTQIDGSLETKRVEIDGMLKPLREMVDNYRGELTRSELARNEVYGGLQEQLKSLLSAQELSHREAARLANALQSPTVRGAWGENTLRRCVELAGMSEFCDFSQQLTFENDEGRRLRPDMIVRLPNERVIAVDAKVPLTDYTAAANEQDPARRDEHLALHVRTLRRHVDALSRREYQASIGESLDFVVLFIPGEHFLSAALMTDPTLFDYAADKKVFLASPTVLLPLFRAIAAGWKSERTEENAKKMHDAALELFNRFVKVMEDISRVGSALEQAVAKYNIAIRSIDTRLWPKGSELQRMAGSGRELGSLDQIEAIPLESSRLRLTTTSDEDAEVIPIRGDT